VSAALEGSVELAHARGGLRYRPAIPSLIRSPLAHHEQPGDQVESPRSPPSPFSIFRRW